jgi:hypothetical protein
MREVRREYPKIDEPVKMVGRGKDQDAGGFAH